MNDDYYKILGVEKNTSKEEIKQAFRKLAHKYHPDKKGGDEAMFKKVSEAYSVLSDDKKRAEYDAYGRVFSGGAQGGANGGFGGFEGFDFSQFSEQGGFEFDLGDIFGDFFGSQRRKTKRGNDIVIDLQIDFKDSIFGVERKVFVTKNSVCDICNGSGAKEGSEMEICSVCNGNGQIHETKKSILGTFSSVKSCDHCNGSGRVPKTKCSNCRGAGIKKEQSEIKINVPAGINDGEMIRMSGEGEAIAGGISGDLYVKIHISKHESLRKEGNNLVMNLNVKLTDALMGSDYNVDVLGEKIKLKIPAGVSFGEILRMKGMGVPVVGGKRGDLLAKINIQMPNKLSRKTKQLVEELKKEGI